MEREITMVIITNNIIMIAVHSAAGTGVRDNDGE